MKRTRHPLASRGAAAACAAVLVLAIGCGGGEPAPSRLAAMRQPSTAQCPETDAHRKHINRFACEMCHPKGGEFGFSGTLPSGTVVSGALTRADGLPLSCTVTCHAPGGTPQPVAWNAGPMTCGSCHGEALLVAGGSSHAPNGDRTACEGCHDLGQHMGGAVRLVNGMEPGTEAMCLRCHSGTGGGLAGNAGTLLVGWQDAAGDWHGVRAGTGSGGTLKEPYVRGEPPLACGSCHRTHSSPNAYLFSASAPIDRAGIGAERLCASCHEGERHAWCVSCHAADPMPAGSACFYCHAHQGVVNFVPPSDYGHDGSEGEGPRCWHCHSQWGPPPLEYAAPVIVNGFVNVETVGPTGATITWMTDEPATSFVDWGVGALDRVSGNTALATSHSVALTGLIDSTTYSFRVRSADAFRNVGRSGLLTFQTPSINAPGVPVIVAEPDFTACGYNAAVTLEWLPVVDPNGDPVEYRLLIDDSSLLDSPSVDTGWFVGTSYSTTFPVSLFRATYYWRVQARDAVHGHASPWSTIDEFWLNRYRIGSCP